MSQTDRRSYRVTRGPLALLGRMTPQGETVTLHPKQAAAHLRAGALEEVAAPPEASAPASPRKAKAKTTPADTPAEA